jgi:hypothetical protein
MASERKPAVLDSMMEPNVQDGPDVKDRAALILLRFAFPNCAIHFAWEKCEEIAGSDDEAGAYLSALASLQEQVHNGSEHR